MVLVASPLCPLGLAITSTSGRVLTLLYYELGIRRPHETHPLTVTFEINLTHTELELAARPPTSTCTNTSTVEPWETRWTGAPKPRGILGYLAIGIVPHGRGRNSPIGFGNLF